MSKKSLKYHSHADLIDLAVSMGADRRWAQRLTKGALIEGILDTEVYPVAQAPVVVETPVLDENSEDSEEPDAEEPDSPGRYDGRPLNVLVRLNPDKDPNHFTRVANLNERAAADFGPNDRPAAMLESEGERLGAWLVSSASTAFCRGVYREMSELMESLAEPVQSAVEYGDRVGRGAIR